MTSSATSTDMRLPHRAPIALSLLAVVLAAGCNSGTEPEPVPDAEVRVQASVAGTPIDTVVLEVTAPDIAVPLLFNLPVTNGVAQGTVHVAAGSDRLFTVRAFDTGGTQTHGGSATTHLGPGRNPDLAIAVLPLTGDQLIIVSRDQGRIRISPAVSVLARGQSVQLTGTIEDSTGRALPGQLLWATSNPGRATVTQSGLVTDGPSHGAVRIAATSGGMAGSASVHALGPLTGGNETTCGLDPAGAAYCWGRDGVGGAPVSPAPAPGGLQFSQIVAGQMHICGLTAAGAAHCWGPNQFGQLGDGTTSSRNTPTPVSGGLSFRSLATQRDHTCGITLSGDAYCWGRNNQGQLGDGSTSNALTPVPVATGTMRSRSAQGGYPTSGKFSMLAPDFEGTCGLTVEGMVYCWGSGFGPLTLSSTPAEPLKGPSGRPLLFSFIDSAWSFGCGVALDGLVWCWGYLSEVLQTTAPLASVPPPQGLRWTEVATTRSTACALSTEARAYCWGGNFRATGTGSAGPTPRPVLNLGGVSSTSPPFVSLAAGSEHTCGVLPDGAVICWGLNSAGQIGNGTTGGTGGTLYHPEPVRVTTSVRFP